MRKRRQAVYVTLFLTLLVLVGCAGMQNPQDMSPEDLSIWANRVYIAEYDSYVQRVAIGGIGEQERAVLETKRRVLSQLYPLLNSYNSYLVSGAVPSQELTDGIINLVYELTGGR